MKKLFLASKFSRVADKVLPYLDKTPGDLHVLFIDTAADPYEGKSWLEEDHSKLVEMGFQVQRYDLKNKVADEVQKTLDAADIIFVAGGNTSYLLQKSSESGFAKLVGEYVAKGKLYIGSSAGSLFAGVSIEPFAIRAADKLAQAINELVKRGVLDSRSAAADWLLDYASTRFGDSNPIGKLEEHVATLK